MSTLPRTLEPEVMDSADEARDYDRMDHAAVNALFVDDFLDALDRCGMGARLASSASPLRILDSGTGTALIPIEFCRRTGTAAITAIDLAIEMLKVAHHNVARAGLHRRIACRLCDGKSLTFPDRSFDAVMSNSIIHHIPEPRAALREMIRVVRPGGLLFVRDLLRPDSDDCVEQLVRTYARGEPLRAQQMFRQSLHAALTLGEVQELLAESGLPKSAVAATSDRHWTISAAVPVGPGSAQKTC